MDGETDCETEEPLSFLKAVLHPCLTQNEPRAMASKLCDPQSIDGLKLCQAQVPAEGTPKMQAE